MEWSYVAVTLLIVACIAAGVTGAVINTWALRSRLYSVEDQVAVMQGTLQREVKTRAGQERWKKPDKDAELLKQMATTTAPARMLNWWERIPGTK